MENNNFNAENLRKNCEEALEKKVAFAYSLVEKWSNEMIKASKKGYEYYYIPFKFYLKDDSGLIHFVSSDAEYAYGFPPDKISIQFYIDYFKARGFKVEIENNSYDYKLIKIYW